MSRAVALLAVSVALAAVGLGFAVGEASACHLNVAGVCVIPGGAGCDPKGNCYPCDPRPGHPLDCW